MLEFERTQEYGLHIDKSLKAMRIKKCPIQLRGNMVVADELESSGRIRIFENTGGVLYLQTDDCDMDYDANLVQIAEIAVSVHEDERKVELEKIYCEYGYNEELVPVLLEQVINFADFYNYGFSVPVSQKKQWKPSEFSRGRAIANVIS